MFKKLLVAAASSMIALSAFAVGANDEVLNSIELKDGSTVHIFKDGKMGMEDRFGRAVYMAAGHVMETKDGKKITMNGNETGRVDRLPNKSQPAP
ncbi:MAG: hypothetical protein EPO19_01820 [Betaproteobacteria bacterium]|nr:MAG: hypothetical protein EPO19_01820 [Betaproteobacteria bacterium]